MSWFAVFILGMELFAPSFEGSEGAKSGMSGMMRIKIWGGHEAGRRCRLGVRFDDVGN